MSMSTPKPQIMAPTHVVAEKIHNILAHDNSVYISDDSDECDDLEDNESVATDAEDKFNIVSIHFEVEISVTYTWCC